MDDISSREGSPFVMSKVSLAVIHKYGKLDWRNLYQDPPTSSSQRPERLSKTMSTSPLYKTEPCEFSGSCSMVRLQSVRGVEVLVTPLVVVLASHLKDELELHVTSCSFSL
jgi:hypothetical protein